MKINETFSYDGAAIEDVYALITDQDFREAACVEQGALEYEVSITSNSVGGHTVTIVRTTPADMPDFIKKLTGDTVKAKQTEEWGAAGADGGREAKVKVSIIGQPAEMNGTAKLVPTGGAPDFIIDGDVKVSIPFIGKKIEPEVAKAILASLRTEVELGTQKLG